MSLLFSIIFFSLNVWASEESFVKEKNEDAFYVFDVGQGNCQFAYFGESELGFLYDCGSSSQQVHPKVQALEGNFSTFFQREKKPIKEHKLEIENSSKKKHDFTFAKDSDEESFQNEEMKKSISSGTVSLENSSWMDMREEIREKIKNCDLKTSLRCGLAS